MSDVLGVVAAIAVVVWVSGTCGVWFIGLLNIVMPVDRDDAKGGLLMFFLPFLWPLALVLMIASHVADIREEAREKAERRRVEAERQQRREIADAERRIAARKAAEERGWENAFHATQIAATAAKNKEN